MRFNYLYNISPVNIRTSLHSSVRFMPSIILALFGGTRITLQTSRTLCAGSTSFQSPRSMQFALDCSHITTSTNVFYPGGSRLAQLQLPLLQQQTLRRIPEPRLLQRLPDARRPTATEITSRVTQCGCLKSCCSKHRFDSCRRVHHHPTCFPHSNNDLACAAAGWGGGGLFAHAHILAPPLTFKACGYTAILRKGGNGYRVLQEVDGKVAS